MMDLDPNEINTVIEMNIKQDPIVKDEPFDSMAIVTLSTSSLVGAVHTQANDAVKSEGDIVDQDFDFDIAFVKEEDGCCGKKVKNEENQASGRNENVDSMAGRNNDQGEASKAEKGKKRRRPRKKNNQRIPKDHPANIKKKHKCQWCEYETSRKYSLALHIRIHTGEKPFQCNICSKTFSQKNSLVQHQKIHSKERPFECTVCFKSFSQNINFKSHLQTHRNELQYGCLKCGTRFGKKQIKDLHELRCKHRQYECYMCQYICFTKIGMKRHVQTKHTGDKGFQCEICGKKFILKHNLQRHLTTHREQFPHRCFKCRRGFEGEAELILHKEICRHQQYQCYICNKFQCNITNLKNHMKFHHTREQLFPCKCCGSHFLRKWNLKQHTKNVHGSKAIKNVLKKI